MNRIPSILLAGLLLILPFAVSHRVADPALLPPMAVFAFGPAALVASVFLFNRASLAQWWGLVKSSMTLLLGVYVFWSVLSMTSAGNTGEALFHLARIAVFAASVVVVALVLYGDRDAFGMVVAVGTLDALVLAALAVGPYYGIRLPGTENAPDLAATLANRNLLSSALCLFMPLALFGVFARQWWKTAVSLVSVAFATAAITLSNTRSAWLALLVGLLVTSAAAISTARGGKKSTRRFYQRRAGMALGVILVVGLTFSTGLVRQPGQENAAARAGQTLDWRTGSTAERLILWRHSLAMTAAHPLLGVGPGMWAIAVNRYSANGLRSADADLFYQRPHNDVLWVLAESGVPAAAAYAALFVLALWMLWRGARQAADAGIRMIILATLFGLTAFVVDSMFSFPRERPLHLLLAAVYLGATLAVTAESLGWRARAPRIGQGLMATVLVVGLGSGLLTVARIGSAVEVAQAQSARSRQDWAGVVYHIDRAKSPWMEVDGSSTPLLWYRGVGYFSTGRTEAALADFAAAYRVNPYHIHVLNNLGTCCEILGRHDEALRYYREALAISPRFAGTLLNLAASYYNAGDYSLADSALNAVTDTTADARWSQYRRAVSAKLAADSGRTR